jgi:hypothetical protein
MALLEAAVEAVELDAFAKEIPKPYWGLKTHSD